MRVISYDLYIRNFIDSRVLNCLISVYVVIPSWMRAIYLITAWVCYWFVCTGIGITFLVVYLQLKQFFILNYFELFWATSGLFFDNDTTFNRPTICSNLTSPYKRKTPERILTQPNNQRKKFHSMWLGFYRDKMESVSRSFYIPSMNMATVLLKYVLAVLLSQV